MHEISQYAACSQLPKKNTCRNKKADCSPAWNSIGLGPTSANVSPLGKWKLKYILKRRICIAYMWSIIYIERERWSGGLSKFWCPQEFSCYIQQDSSCSRLLCGLDWLAMVAEICGIHARPQRECSPLCVKKNISKSHLLSKYMSFRNTWTLTPFKMIFRFYSIL